MASRYFLTFLAFLFSTQVAFANRLTEVTVTGEGTGATEEIATRNALANAVSQAGLNISINSELVTDVLRLSSGNNDNAMLALQSRAESTSLQAEGEIKSWRKISSSRIDGGLFLVIISADLYRFELGGASNRIRMALLPINVGTSIQRGNEINIFEADILNHLVQSRRFTVLSRNNINHILNEHNFVLRNNVARGERTRIGNLLGADVLVHVSIVQASFDERNERIPITGQVRRVISGGVKINVSIFDASTGQIRYANNYSIDADSSYQSLSAVLAEIAKIVSSDIIYGIFPLRIIQVNPNGEIFLNTGGSLLSVGQILTVYKEGDQLIDPYSGESLGSAENQVGLIEISRVESRFSAAVILEGNEFQPSMIARPSMLRSGILNFDEGGVKDHHQSGVKLPFDR
jgi:hypothetical protein